MSVLYSKQSVVPLQTGMLLVYCRGTRCGTVGSLVFDWTGVNKPEFTVVFSWPGESNQNLQLVCD